jgi:hypothetical protein
MINSLPGHRFDYQYYIFCIMFEIIKANHLEMLFKEGNASFGFSTNTFLVGFWKIYPLT